MSSSVNAEVYACIRELRAIANELEDAAEQVEKSIQGMNTRKYTRELYRCAAQYRRAADKLDRIR